MKSKTSHQSNENFALQTQFPFVCFIVGWFQNFHDKTLKKKRISMVTIQPYIRIIIKNHSSFTLNVFDQKYIPTITKIIASTNRAVETSNSDSIPKFKNGDFIKKELDRKIGTD
ncbi:MAG: hypothetical protein WCJ47_07620, partial [Methanomicrobiales archaeon]